MSKFDLKLGESIEEVKPQWKQPQETFYGKRSNGRPVDAPSLVIPEDN